MANFFSDFISDLKKNDSDDIICTPKELAEQQFGIPLKHFAQQYLFGSTGMRLQTFHSISGIPQSCKSPFLFDLMGDVCEPDEDGEVHGLSILGELEDKLSVSLLNSMLMKHGGDVILDKNFIVLRKLTLNKFMDKLTLEIIPKLKKAKKWDVPVLVGIDSIGGSGTKDVVDKINKEGTVGKGLQDKPHIMKNFCENASAIIGYIPMVVVCINQEKEKIVANPYGPQPKDMMKITGGVSQVYKDGFMVHTDYKKLASGTGKVITMRTLKTSFCDDRSIIVNFRWNNTGKDEKDAYGHHFEWALASANVLASPEKGVGEIRDICDVKVSEKGLVTCPTFDLKSAPAEEFEAALFSPEHEKVLNSLYTYLKIDKLKDVQAYAEYMNNKGKDVQEEAAVEKPEKAKKTKTKKDDHKDTNIVSMDDVNVEM